MSITEYLPAMGLLLVFALAALAIVIRYGKKKRTPVLPKLSINN